MDGVVREVNAGVLVRGLKLADENDCRFEIMNLLFGDGAALVRILTSCVDR